MALHAVSHQALRPLAPTPGAGLAQRQPLAFRARTQDVIRFSANLPAENPAVFDPNHIEYDPTAIYSKDGTLTWGQKVCDFLIRQVYQRPTRSTIYKWFGNPCPFKRRGHKLSCSEFTLVSIHRLGVIRGIWEGAKRLLRCNPMTRLADQYSDPVVTLNCFPWNLIGAT